MTTRTPTALDALAEQWLDTMLQHHPEMHVELGRPGRESDYADRSPDGAAAANDAARAMLAQAQAAEPSDAVDVVTRLELIRTLQDSVDQYDAGFWQRDLNVIASPGQDLRDIFDLMPTDSPEHWEHIARRMQNIPAAMSGYIESLRAGIAARNAPAIRQVVEVTTQARKQTGPSSFFHTLVTAGSEAGASESLRAELVTGATAAADAYAALVEFLDDELAPHAPQHDAVGRDFYAIASRGFVGATIDLDETYEWGIDELGRMLAEQKAIADEILPGSTPQEAIAHLEADPARTIHGTDALKAWMQDKSDRAIDELGRTHFDIPEQMRELECLIAPTQEGGIYYTPPSDDFSRPGRMWWSVPEGLTEFAGWQELTTVYHEGVPGHHLQCATAVYNRAELNGWRRFNWNSGHGEGWALYAERLMATLGYLDDPADRMGMLDGQLIRAARVVIDIGVHLEKPKPDGSGTWHGNDAYDFLRAHSTLPESMARFESNRYLGWPGQAPSYKVGQRLWEQLRDEFVATKGDDLKEFHRRALAVGSIGMDTLRQTLLG